MIIELNAALLLLLSIIAFGLIGRAIEKHFETDKEEDIDDD
jgi:hypothetical protein